jgi:hypothetical protein
MRKSDVLLSALCVHGQQHLVQLGNMGLFIGLHYVPAARIANSALSTCQHYQPAAVAAIHRLLPTWSAAGRHCSTQTRPCSSRSRSCSSS